MRRGRAAIYLGLLVVILWLGHPRGLIGQRFVEWGEERKIRLPETERVLRFDTPKGHGLSVQLQTLLLQHHIAHITNRTLAFEPILVDPPATISYLARIASALGLGHPSAYVPVSAFVSSLTSHFETLYDGLYPVPVTAPRIATICSHKKADSVEFQTPWNPEGTVVPESEGQKLVHQMQLEIGSRDAPCVWLKGNVLDYSFFQSPAPVELLESLLVSPVIKHYWPSRRVMELLNEHIKLLAPENSPYGIERALKPSKDMTKATQWRSLLVLHLPSPSANWRQTCEIAAQHRLPFYGFNKLTPPLPGNDNLPPAADAPQPVVDGLYAKKCRPPVLDVIQRARRLRKNHPLLKSVYVITDLQKPKSETVAADAGYSDPAKWHSEIRMWLESEGWEHVWIARDDIWSGEKVGEGVDLEVARRAGVFIGNGFSPFASNAVLLRQRDGIHRDLTQFW